METLLKKVISEYVDVYGYRAHIEVLADLVNVLITLYRFRTEYEADVNKYPVGSTIHGISVPEGDMEGNVCHLLDLMKFVTKVLLISEGEAL